jgi:hypothetical protein
MTVAAPDELTALGNFLRELNPPEGHGRITEFLKGLLIAAKKQKAEHERFSTARLAEHTAEIASLEKYLGIFESFRDLKQALAETDALRKQARIDADAAAAMRKRVESSLRAAGVLSEAR